jgi:hypothetical protein
VLPEGLHDGGPGRVLRVRGSRDGLAALAREMERPVLVPVEPASELGQLQYAFRCFVAEHLDRRGIGVPRGDPHRVGGVKVRGVVGPESCGHAPLRPRRGTLPLTTFVGNHDVGPFGEVQSREQPGGSRPDDEDVGLDRLDHNYSPMNLGERLSKNACTPSR